MARRRPVWACLGVTLLLGTGVLAGCGSDASEGVDPGTSQDAAPDAGPLAEAADTTVCAADAEPLAVPDGVEFPTDWVFPPLTTVYDVEAREGTGVIVTAVSTSSFEEVLAFLNDDEPAAGYVITGGETEDDDAEADFTLADHTGRWSIRASASCAGETVVQVVTFDPGGQQGDPDEG